LVSGLWVGLFQVFDVVQADFNAFKGNGWVAGDELGVQSIVGVFQAGPDVVKGAGLLGVALHDFVDVDFILRHWLAPVGFVTCH
jgi:hypothetical protein